MHIQLTMKTVAIVVLVACDVWGSALVSGAEEMSPAHHQRRMEAPRTPQALDARACLPSQDQTMSPQFEGLQIETSDITLYELFFETILRAQRIQHMDHPQVDSLRGYCVYGVPVVVRQDLRTPRPTGWVQINFSVPNVAAIQEELEQASKVSPVAHREEADRARVVRIRLKPDVRRGACRAVRLEVGGPEGFMIGFDQFKEGTCQGSESEGRSRDSR